MSGEIVKTEAGALVAADFLKGVTGHEGLENVTKDDIVLPRLSVCQSMTRERKKQNEELYIEGLEEGDLFNNLTKAVVKQGDHVDFIPVYYSTSRIWFKDIKDGGGILCQSFNGIDGGTVCKTCAACPKSQFTTAEGKNEPPECTELKNVICKNARTGELFISSFKSMELKNARKWLTTTLARNKPAYAQVYRMATKPTSNAKGDFFTRVIKFLGFVDEERALPGMDLAARFALYQAAKSDYEGMRGRVIDTAAEVAEHEQESGGDRDEDAPPSDEDIPF